MASNPTSPRKQAPPTPTEFDLGTRVTILREYYRCDCIYTSLHVAYRLQLPTEKELKRWASKRNLIGRAVLEGLENSNSLPRATLPLAKINGEIFMGLNTSHSRVKVMMPAPIYLRCEVLPFWTRPGGSPNYVILEPWLDYEAKYMPTSEVPNNGSFRDELRRMNDDQQQTLRTQRNEMGRLERRLSAQQKQKGIRVLWG